MPLLSIVIVTELPKGTPAAASAARDTISFAFATEFPSVLRIFFICLKMPSTAFKVFCSALY